MTVPVPAPNQAPDPLSESDEHSVLQLQALAALRRTRLKANGNFAKTRMAVEVVDEEVIKDPNDSRVMRTLRLKRVNGLIVCDEGEGCICVQCSPPAAAGSAEA